MLDPEYERLPEIMHNHNHRLVWNIAGRTKGRPCCLIAKQSAPLGDK